MPILIECEECGAKFRVGDDRAGTVLPCKNCDADMRVPGARRGPASPQRQYRAEPDEPASRGGVPWPVWVFGGLGIAAVVATAIVLIVLNLNGSKEPVADKDDKDGSKKAAANLTAAEWSNQLAEAERVHRLAVETAEARLRTELSGALRRLDNAQDRQQLGREARAFILDTRQLPRLPAVRAAVESYRTARTKADRELIRKLDALLESPPADVDAQAVANVVSKKGNLQRSADALARQDLDAVAANNPGLPGRVANAGPPAEVPARPKGGFIKPKTKNGNAGLFVWKVKVDGSPEKFTLPDNYKLSLSLPPNTRARDISFAKGHSPFVAIGKNHSKTEVRSVVDLRTQKIVGRIGGFQDFHNKAVLDPSGQYFARANTTTKGVFVWDIAANSHKGTLPLETINNKYVGFAGKKRLLAIGGGFAKPLNVWKLPSGDPERTIPLPKTFDVASVTTTPGGRYVAFYETIYNPAVRVYDLDTGNLAGSLTTEFGGNNSGNCSVLEFSPDGKELAGLFNFGFAEWIACWDVATGKLQFSHEFAERMRFKLGVTHPQPLQWFPNKQRWLLYGQVLFDRKAQKPVFSIPSESDQRMTRKVLDDTHITSLAGTQRRPVLVSLKFDEKLIPKQ